MFHKTSVCYIWHTVYYYKILVFIIVLYTVITRSHFNIDTIISTCYSYCFFASFVCFICIALNNKIVFVSGNYDDNNFVSTNYLLHFCCMTVFIFNLKSRMFLVVSFKRPDRMAAASVKVRPFNESQPRTTRKRKKPGDSEYSTFCLRPSNFVMYCA